PAPATLSTGWLIGVARHKLSDHWRRQAREERTLRAVAAEPEPGPADPWDETLDAVTAREVLGLLGPHHRAALTLRYVDDLPVPEVAAILGRTVHATAALLGRIARRCWWGPGRLPGPVTKTGEGSAAMTDRLAVRRAPLRPADPDPAFAGRLRDRLERALGLPEGVAVTDISMTLAERETTALPEERGAAIPYLAVRGGRDALDWYARVLGARLRGEPVIMPDGRVGHAELELAHGVMYLADEFPEIGVRAPDPAGVPVSLVLAVADVDEVVAAAVEAGARLDRPP